MGTTLAQAQTRSTIGFIDVEGNQRIEDETVISYMKVVPGDPFDSTRIDDSLKNLYSTGLFADVSMRREGSTLIVQVVENPIINRIAFEGNKRIKDDVLAAEVQLRPRVVYTRTRVQKDVARILELYRRSGRFAARVEPKVIQLAQNRVDLAFEIQEGAKTGVQRISFIGNRNFSDSTLREVIQTKQSRWWRFLGSTDSYDPDRLSFDRELLRRHYLKEGFADFRVVNAVAELTPNRENFYVTFTVEEGERYEFGEIILVSDLPNLDPEVVRDVVTTETGDWYDAEAVEESVQAVTDDVTGLGYAFVDVRPQVQRDRENLTIDVTFDIQEGPRVYVQRINITGNVRTLDRIIRRNVRLAEGDAFNSARLRKSRELIDGLGFFSNVNVTNEAGDGPDQTIINVDVTEQSTGEVSFGAGFSTTERLLGTVAIQERNLLGRGQNLRVAFTISALTQDLQLSFTEPYFLNRDVAAGFDIFNATIDRPESSFEQDRLGFILRSSYRLAEHLTQSVRYTLSRDEVIPDAGAAPSIVAQAGTTTRSVLGQTLVYDRLDNRNNPRKGYFAQWSLDFAGIGGDRRWIRNSASTGRYFTFFDQYILSMIGEVSYITGIGDQDVEISDRFFLGGNSFRGFAVAGVGPRDANNNNALGGNLLYKATGELEFPIGLPEELGVTGRVFGIAGTLTDVDVFENVNDTGALRASVGIGVSWASPFGPVRIDIAKPVLSESFDEEELFTFGFGSFF